MPSPVRRSPSRARRTARVARSWRRAPRTRCRQRRSLRRWRNLPPAIAAPIRADPLAAAGAAAAGRDVADDGSAVTARSRSTSAAMSRRPLVARTRRRAGRPRRRTSHGVSSPWRPGGQGDHPRQHGPPSGREEHARDGRARPRCRRPGEELVVLQAQGLDGGHEALEREREGVSGYEDQDGGSSAEQPARPQPGGGLPDHGAQCGVGEPEGGEAREADQVGAEPQDEVEQLDGGLGGARRAAPRGRQQTGIRGHQPSQGHRAPKLPATPRRGRCWP